MRYSNHLLYNRKICVHLRIPDAQEGARLTLALI
jgi:hypothetical protein